MNGADVAIIFVLFILFGGVFGIACIIHYEQHQADIVARKVCDSYPVFAMFERDGNRYAICVEPDAGLVAKRMAK